MVRGLDPSGVVRRCPTLPHPSGCSTIGAVGLSFRVRDGTGRFPHAMTAVTRAPRPAPGPPVGRVGGVGSSCHRLVAVDSVVCCATRGPGGVVGWEPYSGRGVLCVPTRGPNQGLGGGCGVSCRPISTGRLRTSLVRASTSGLSTQWSRWGPLAHKVRGNLISKRASRLDAFSGYLFRT